jgi:putative transcriptional regulator
MSAIPADVPLSDGIFLIAAPGLLDPNFRRSVVLLCEYHAQGAMGLIVNRPSRTKLSEVLPVLDGRTTGEAPVHIGGPVSRQAILILHRLADVPGGRELVDGVRLGGEPAALTRALQGEDCGTERLRLYAGYAGWGAGQLDHELTQGGWITCAARARFVFETPPTRVWSALLRDLGGRYRLLSAFPPDPNLN